MFTNKRTKNLNFDKVKINKIPIEYSDGASYLGTFLDAKLTFKKHIEDKIKKCKTHLFALKKKFDWQRVGPISMAYEMGLHRYYQTKINLWMPYLQSFFFKRKHIKKILKCIENFKHVNFQYKSVLLPNERWLKFHVSVSK